MINIDVVTDNKSWDKRIKKPKKFFNETIQFFPKKYKFKNKKVNLTLLLSNNRNIKKLNKKFRKKNKSTDVLSFPFEENFFIKDQIYLGDIAISFEFINVPRTKSNLEFTNKLLETFIHGFLHLLNYDHIRLKDFNKMQKEEIKIYKAVNEKNKKFI